MGLSKITEKEIVQNMKDDALLLITQTEPDEEGNEVVSLRRAKISTLGIAEQTALERLKYYGDANIVPTDASLFEFDSETGTIALTTSAKEDVTLTNIVIPYEIDGVKVTNIGDYGFVNSSNLTSITIPNGVASIGGGAFSGCTNLTSIIIPSGVPYINGETFYGCSNLKNITIPNGVNLIGTGAFLNCSKLTNVNIPDGVHTIDEGAFLYCSNLKTITIPDSVTTFSDYPIFDGCSEDLTIICSQGSTAETYAKEQGIKCMYDVVENDTLIINCGDENVDAFSTTSEMSLLKIDKSYEEVKEAIEKNKHILIKAYNGDLGFDVTYKTITASMNNDAFIYLTLSLGSLNVVIILKPNGAFYICSDIDIAIDNKYDKTTITTSEETDPVLELQHNVEIRYGELASLSITSPAEIATDFISSIIFASGETATNLEYPEDIIMSGEDCINSVFAPVENKRYTVIISYDGVYLTGIVGGVSI